MLENTVPFFEATFRHDRSRNATVQVFEHLRELIVSLAIAPGTVLARPQLCAYFGLSQAPIREALLRLEEERLVDIYPQHQTRVRGIDLASARQAHFQLGNTFYRIMRVEAGSCLSRWGRRHRWQGRASNS